MICDHVSLSSFYSFGDLHIYFRVAILRLFWPVCCCLPLLRADFLLSANVVLLGMHAYLWYAAALLC